MSTRRGIPDPSKPLRNRRWEAFAQRLATGDLMAVEAYSKVFPKSKKWRKHSLAVRASDMARKPEIALRVAWLQGRGAAKASKAFVEHIEMLSLASRAPMIELDPARAREAAGGAIDLARGLRKERVPIRLKFKQTVKGPEVIAEEVDPIEAGRSLAKFTGEEPPQETNVRVSGGVTLKEAMEEIEKHGRGLPTGRL